MKKTMMFLAVIAIAGVTEAGSVRWSMLNNAVVWKDTGTAVTTVGQQYYLVLASDQASIISAINGGTFSGGTAGVLGMGTASTTKGYVASAAVFNSGLAVGTSYNLSVLVFDSLSGTDYYQFSSSIPQAAWDGTTDIGATAGFAAANFNTANWTAVVPEPTSMALLALGVAAVGLRRRFKK
jgi:hypothetical protein